MKKALLIFTLIILLCDTTNAALIAHWKMDDNAATTVVVDETGNHNGTFTDATGDPNTHRHDADGKRATALDFDGTDDYVEVADHDDFSPISTPFSVSAWGYMTAVDQTDTLVSKVGVGDTYEWRLGGLMPGRFSFRISDLDTSNFIGRKYDALDTAGYADRWFHLVGTYNGGTTCSGVKLYLNGVQVDDADVTAGTFEAVHNTAQVVRIGRSEAAASHFTGYIDDVRIYDHELTQGDINTLYLNTRNRRGHHR